MPAYLRLRLALVLGAAIVGTLAGWLPLEAWLGAAAFFWSGCPCCESSPCPLVCSTYYGSGSGASVTVAGIANGTCSECTSYNATIATSLAGIACQKSGVGYCASAGSPCFGYCITAYVVFSDYGAGTLKVASNVDLTADNAGGNVDTGIAIPTDCTAVGTVPITIVSYGGTRCDMSATTLTVVT